MCRKRNKIKFSENNDLVFAAYHAKTEADKWSEIAKKMLNDTDFIMQSSVLLSYSSELYLKSLLLILDVNVMEIFKNNDGHNLFKLYDALPDSYLKISIASNVIYSSYELSKNISSRKEMIEKFEESIKNISRAYIDYRYLYEKFLINQTIYIPIEFIYNLNAILKKECEVISYEKIDENGKKYYGEDIIINYYISGKGWVEDLDEI